MVWRHIKTYDVVRCSVFATLVKFKIRSKCRSTPPFPFSVQSPLSLRKTHLVTLEEKNPISLLKIEVYKVHDCVWHSKVNQMEFCRLWRSFFSELLLSNQAERYWSSFSAKLVQKIKTKKMYRFGVFLHLEVRTSFTGNFAGFHTKRGRRVSWICAWK